MDLEMVYGAMPLFFTALCTFLFCLNLPEDPSLDLDDSSQIIALVISFILCVWSLFRVFVFQICGRKSNKGSVRTRFFRDVSDVEFFSLHMAESSERLSNIRNIFERNERKRIFLSESWVEIEKASRTMTRCCLFMWIGDICNWSGYVNCIYRLL